MTHPDSVSRVHPPNTTIPKTLAALTNSQYATAFELVSGKLDERTLRAALSVLFSSIVGPAWLIEAVLAVFADTEIDLFAMVVRKLAALRLIRGREQANARWQMGLSKPARQPKNRRER